MSLHRTRTALRSTLGSPWLTPLWSPLTAGRVSIFALHRFAADDLGVPGHDPVELGRTLGRLRRERYNLLGLGEAVARLRAGDPLPRRAAVFTVDDGYADFAAVGAGVFAEYDCPVTVFLATGFVDGTHWMWWDQIAFVFAATRLPHLRLELDGAPLSIPVPPPEQRAAAAHRLAVRCTRIPTEVRRELVKALATAAEVELPTRPPERFRAVSWDEVRGLESRGVTFGPHTVDHPILVQTTDAEAEWQIRESWRVVRSRTQNPLPVLAYPNGDHSTRETRIVNESGLLGAVTCVETYASREASTDRYGGLARIPRLSYPESTAAVCLAASGFGRVTAAVRRARVQVGA